MSGKHAPECCVWVQAWSSLHGRHDTLTCASLERSLVRGMANVTGFSLELGLVRGMANVTGLVL
jgi:hypothetical protein